MVPLMVSRSKLLLAYLVAQACNADARDHRWVAKHERRAGEAVEQPDSGAKKNRRDVDVAIVERASIQALLDGASSPGVPNAVPSATTETKYGISDHLLCLGRPSCAVTSQRHRSVRRTHGDDRHARHPTSSALLRHHSRFALDGLGRAADPAPVAQRHSGPQGATKVDCRQQQ